jgi:hypothetical protein
LTDNEFQEFETFTMRELLSSSDSFLKCPNPECSDVIERVPFTGDRRGKRWLIDLLKILIIYRKGREDIKSQIQNC